MNDFDDKMKQSMADQFQKMQTTLATTRVSGVSGIEDEDDMYVKVTIDGLQQVQEIKIGQGAYSSGVEIVADLTKAAMNNALEKLKSVMQTEFMALYKNSGLPTDNVK